MIHAQNKTSMKYGAGLKTLKAYLIGFTLSLLLTLIAFVVVGKQLLNTPIIYIILAGLAILQLLVQVICFLRINTSPEGRWNLMPFLFTLLIIIVLVFGSFWIMYNLNYNMVH